MYKFNMFNGSLVVGQCTYCVFDLSLFSKVMCLYGNMFPNCTFSIKVLLNFTFSTCSFFNKSHFQNAKK